MARPPTKPKGARIGVGPQRTCVACRRVGPPESFVRISVVHDVTDHDVFDHDAATDRVSVAVGRFGGRGTWLCPAQTCVALLVKRRPLSRALRCEIPPDAYAALATELSELISTSPTSPSVPA